VKLYREIDSPVGVREVKHIYKIVAETVGGSWQKTPDHVRRLAIAAIGYDRHGSDVRKLTLRERSDLMWLNSQKIAAFFTNVCAPFQARHMMKEPVFCAMLKTWRVDSKEAAAFWTDVRDANMIAMSNPAHILHDWLLSNARRSPDGTRVVIVSWSEVYDRCIHAWNNHRTGSKKVYKKGQDSVDPR
jgi:hypothetical protein